jgi:hypothetical protein
LAIWETVASPIEFRQLEVGTEFGSSAHIPSGPPLVGRSSSIGGTMQPAYYSWAQRQMMKEGEKAGRSALKISKASIASVAAAGRDGPALRCPDAPLFIATPGEISMDEVLAMWLQRLHSSCLLENSLLSRRGKSSGEHCSVMIRNPMAGNTPGSQGAF